MNIWATLAGVFAPRITAAAKNLVANALSAAAVGLYVNDDQKSAIVAAVGAIVTIVINVAAAKVETMAAKVAHQDGWQVIAPNEDAKAAIDKLSPKAAAATTVDPAGNGNISG